MLDGKSWRSPSWSSSPTTYKSCLPSVRFRGVLPQFVNCYFESVSLDSSFLINLLSVIVSRKNCP